MITTHFLELPLMFFQCSRIQKGRKSLCSGSSNRGEQPLLAEGTGGQRSPEMRREPGRTGRIFTPTAVGVAVVSRGGGAAFG